MSAPVQPELLVNHGGARAYHASWQQLAEIVRAEGGCSAVIVDAPYAGAVHSGHDHGVRETRIRPQDAAEYGASDRRTLDYTAWTDNEVCSFVSAWAPLTRGWLVSLTDDRLFQSWRAAMDDADRVTFQDLPILIRGMTVRLAGDGPSSWAIHCAVSRPRSREFATWGTLDGGYVGPSERQAVVGGKPLWLMRALVRDYTRPGDLIVDPCCGAGTTLLAARLEGRRAIGGDILREHAELAAERLRPLPTREDKTRTLALFGGDRG